MFLFCFFAFYEWNGLFWWLNRKRVDMLVSQNRKVMWMNIHGGNAVVKVDGFVGVDDCDELCEPHFVCNV